jgi:DNA-binding response OmpR family regulator
LKENGYGADGFKKILIVDDDEMVREIIREILSAPDIVISECSNCSEARAEFETNSFDIVILDNFMPDGQGLDLVKEASECCDNIIFISANAYNKEIYSKAIARGVDSVLEKPFEVWQLKKCVEYFFSVK